MGGLLPCCRCGSSEDWAYCIFCAIDNLMLPFSEACERNKEPILSVLKNVFSDTARVLEIGSGTGQHAVFFSGELPHLTWQPSDFGDYLPGLEARIAGCSNKNLRAPAVLDVRGNSWPKETFDAVFSANSLHIMSWGSVELFFQGVGSVLGDRGALAIYGPFNYQGNYSSSSNQNFDGWLKDRDPLSGIRDFEAVDELAQRQGLRLVEDYSMPANNQCIVWKRAYGFQLKA